MRSGGGGGIGDGRGGRVEMCEEGVERGRSDESQQQSAICRSRQLSRYLFMFVVFLMFPLRRRTE